MAGEGSILVFRLVLSTNMASPFPISSSAPGEGQLIVRLLPHDVSALATMSFQYPLKLISPSPTSWQKSVLVFLLTYGGGLVGGDQVHLQVVVQSQAKLSMVTQGHTKIFKSPSRDVITRQTLSVTVEAGSSMCLLPDPVQPFRESVYEQSQIFTLGEGASICLLDWVSQGRLARGENWDFGLWRGRNEVWSTATASEKARLLLRDSVILAGDTPQKTQMPLKEKMHRLGLFGTLILRGPLVEKLASFFLAEFATLPRIGARDFRSDEDKHRDRQSSVTSRELWRISRLKQEKDEEVQWSAAKIRGCTVVKFGTRTVEGGRHWIGSMIQEEGSIEQVFGEAALMCIKP